MINRKFLLPLLAAGALLTVGPAFAASAAGPEPYTAADPVYAAPMTKEPVISTPIQAKASLGDTDNINGPAAGPEPYTAADPVYPPKGKEPVYNAPAKTPSPKL